MNIYIQTSEPLTQDQLKERFEYNPDTGFFIYRIAIAQMKPGDIAGNANTNGHIQIEINYRPYLAHNLAWFYMTGEWPNGFIVDHINRNYADNRWINFRKATHSQNQGNRKKHKLNKSGYRGVNFVKKNGKFQAQISINNKKVWLGYFVTAELAYEAYLKVAKEHFGEFYNDD